MVQTYMGKLESSIQMNFDKWVEENDKKKMDFDVSHIQFVLQLICMAFLLIFLFLCTDYGREERSHIT